MRAAGAVLPTHGGWNTIIEHSARRRFAVTPVRAAVV